MEIPRELLMKVRAYAMGSEKGTVVCIESKVVTNSVFGDLEPKDATVTTTCVYLTPSEVEELIVKLHEQVAQAMKMKDWAKPS